MLKHLCLLLLGLASLSLVSAQEDICLQRSEYRWTYNSLQQSPCVVAGILLSVCLNNTVTIRTLDGLDDNYPGAQASGEGSACRCSTVYYSMLSACAYCQAHDWITWIEQRQNCIDISDRHLPILIPTNTSVSNFAYADVIANARFDIAAAQAMLSAQTLSSTTSGTTSTPVTVTSTGPTSPSTSNPGVTAERKSTNIGAIVGGVVGGLIIIGIAVVVIIWLAVRSRRKSSANTNLLAPNSPNPSAAHTSPYMSSMGYPAMPSPPLTATGSPMLYNPNDPSTFPVPQGSNPTTPSVHAIHTGASPTISATQPTMWVHNHRTTGYDGAA